MPYAAAIFDLDGTLIDSIPLWLEAYLGALKQLGTELDREEFLQTMYTRNAAAGSVLKELGIGCDHEQEFRKIRDTWYCKLLRTNDLWLDNTEALLPKITADIPTAIVTGSWDHYVDAIDANIGIRKIIPTIVTASEIPSRQKPHPDLLLLAAERLKVDPFDCIYIGDQSFDIAAAKNAGMDSCLLKGDYTPDDVDGADIVVTSFEELVSNVFDI